MSHEYDHYQDFLRKRNRIFYQQRKTESGAPVVELPILFRERPLSRVLKDKKRNLVSKKARHKK